MIDSLYVAGTPDEAADLAVMLILEAVSAKPHLVLGLAAGRTFEPVHEALALARPDLSAATLVQLDEYVGPGPESPHSFHAFIRSTLLGRLPHEPARTLLLNGAAPDPEAEIRRHRLALASAGGLDLQLLGLGRNGHLAFNEPGTLASEPARVVGLAEVTRLAASAQGLVPPPSHGMTLGLAEILTARAVILVVLGEAKAAVLARAFQSPPAPDLPASLLQSHPALTVIADEAAAALLNLECGAVNA